MEAEAVLNLLDSSWFYIKPFENQPNPSIGDLNPNPRITEIPPEPCLTRRLTIHTRSKSDQLIKIPIVGTDVFSPRISRKPNLQTILSGREIDPLDKPVKEFTEPATKKKKEKKKIRFTKSLSELEFEEMKGFMDLGFVFSEEDKKDPGLVEIVPGLQKLGLEEGRRVEQLVGPRARPYLSEAWGACDRETGPGPLLMELIMPAVMNEIDMKDSLKWWAHSVASAVR
ncbi:hypothetical protein STAS_00053 [Striga asiatica]|uniref:Uncharacterized protein n=1 Tax=Striga asiatica TaxID=4170 RepID=A0A5A7NV48_STRAF|nr:hypothetical protein STAS_00053 [Striga asiatica]